MTAEINVGGRRLRYNDATPIGRGGEAEIFDLGDGRVFKRFKVESHPDLALDAGARRAARHRIAEHQKKLPALLALAPKLPSSVVVPEAVATDRTGTVTGYVMPFLAGAEVMMRFAERDYRTAVPVDAAINVLRDLHATVGAVHAPGVVIGDFNDLNVLVKDGRAHLIDADSFQFGAFTCGTFTSVFVDPTRCDPAASAPMLTKPHTVESDWYAFTVMVMQTLLFVGPFGGIFRPKDPAHACLHGARPLRRITVFHPEVRYPKPALPPDVLPDDLLQHFHEVFERDRRGVFPAKLLEMRWTRCACGAEHARPLCPRCAAAVPGAVRETTQIRGSVTATRLFQTRGRILRAELVGGRPAWLYEEGGELRREDGARLGRLPLDPYMRARLRAGRTLVGKGGILETTPVTVPGRTGLPASKRLLK